MSNGTSKKRTKKVSLKKRSKKSRAVDAAVSHIKKTRKKQGKKKKKIARRAIEQAIINDTGLTQAEVNAALNEAYDELTDLGALTKRKVRKKKKVRAARA